MIKNLQSLRGICAMLIITHHFGFAAMQPAGVWSVAVFGMLSGLVLSIAFAQRAKAGELPGFGSFMRKRMVRIYPLYLLGLVWSLALMKFQAPAATVVANLLMVQSWIPDPDVYFAINAPAWFVSGLMVRYLLFLPATRAMHHRPRLFYGGVGLLAAIYFSCALLLPERLLDPLVYIFPPMQLLIFALGMLGYQWLASGRLLPRSGRTQQWLAAGVMGLIVAMMFADHLVTVRLTLSSYWWAPTLLLLLLLTLTDTSRGLLTRLLHSRSLLALGAISYPLYILHKPFIQTYRILLRHTGLDLPLPLSFLICATLLIIFSLGANRLISQPLTRLLSPSRKCTSR